MVSLRGMVRFEMDRPIFFSNIKEHARGSIYRRSLVIEMEGVYPEKRIRSYPRGNSGGGKHLRE